MVAAFGAVYIIWGSTYLAIRIAVETLPPFVMAGVRFVIAGVLLYGWTRWRGAAPPQRIHWRSALVIGGLLLLGGNGGVVWAEQHIPSGLAALLVATVPLWMVLIDAVRPGGTGRPTGKVWAGLAMGLVGVALLIGPGNLLGGQRVNMAGVAAVLLGALSWALGSLYARQAELPRAPLQVTAMEMLAGGALLLIAATATSQWGQLDITQVSAASLLAVAYLIFFGSIVAFTAYGWLLKTTTPAKASTYAYVNPMVAVFLGWALADEPLTPQMLIAATIIIASVALITTKTSPTQSQATAADTTTGNR
jgi:drug/metabolite transporter (DMT)-like permease